MVSGVTSVATTALPSLARGYAQAAPAKDQSQKSREFCTQPIDRRFERMVNHIAHHHHAAWHLLALSVQFPVLELRHRALAMDQGAEQGHHGITTDAVTLSEFCDFLPSCRRKLSHHEHPLCG